LREGAEIVLDRGNSKQSEDLKVKNAQDDGHFFIGVSSTGIYCRPICSARQPKAENITFYGTAAEAEQAGYRPCLLCRPELAPGVEPARSAASLAYFAARFMEENCGDNEILEILPLRFNCTENYLQHEFITEYHVLPKQYLQTCRMLLAKSLFTDANLSMDEVAQITGLENEEKLDNLFQKKYRLKPAALRRKNHSSNISAITNSNTMTLQLGYRPPYQWEQLLDFLDRRAISGIEIVRNGEYLRTVHLIDKDNKKVTGWLKASHLPKKNRLAVTMNKSLMPILPKVLSRIDHLFDLRCDPGRISETISSLNAIHQGLSLPGIRLPGCFDPFEMAVRAILGQQVTVKAAGTLAKRLVEAFGVPIKTGVDGLTHIFPSPEVFMALKGSIADHLGPLGITSARAQTILELARVTVEGGVDFDFYTSPETELNKLKNIAGIGDWTANYIGMRAMRWADAFPHTDYGVKKALAPRTPKEILALAEDWRPWRAYAAISLWNSL